MKKTFECPCEKNETVIRLSFCSYGDERQFFLRLTPETKKFFEFLTENDLLDNEVVIDWEFDLQKVVKEF